MAIIALLGVASILSGIVAFIGLFANFSIKPVALWLVRALVFSMVGITLYSLIAIALAVLFTKVD